MAQILTEAFAAYDGTIFSSKADCESYEMKLFQSRTPMLYVVRKQDAARTIELMASNQITNVDFIQFTSFEDKKQFVELRKNAAKTYLYDAALNSYINNSVIDNRPKSEEANFDFEPAEELIDEENNIEETISNNLNELDKSELYIDKWEYSTQGLHDEDYPDSPLGAFVLMYDKHKKWVWRPLAMYKTILQEKLDASIDAGILLSQMYAYK